MKDNARFLWTINQKRGFNVITAQGRATTDNLIDFIEESPHLAAHREATVQELYSLWEDMQDMLSKGGLLTNHGRFIRGSLPAIAPEDPLVARLEEDPFFEIPFTEARALFKRLVPNIDARPYRGPLTVVAPKLSQKIRLYSYQPDLKPLYDHWGVPGESGPKSYSDNPLLKPFEGRYTDFSRRIGATTRISPRLAVKAVLYDIMGTDPIPQTRS